MAATLRWKEVVPAVGAEVTSHTTSDLADLARKAEAGKADAQTVLGEVASALLARGLVVLHKGDGKLVSPEEVDRLYKQVHLALGYRIVDLPFASQTVGAGARSRNTQSINRAFFEGSDGRPLFTQLLGHAPEPLENFHGLSGTIYMNRSGFNTSSANLHMDGAYDGVAAPPPALISMYCEEAPKRGRSTLLLGGNAYGGGISELKPLAFEAGSTFFCSTKAAVRMADPALLARARNLNCVYHRGFAKFKNGTYPIMAPSLLCSKVESPDAKAKEGERRGPAALGSFGLAGLEQFLHSHEKNGDPQGFSPRRNYSLDDAEDGVEEPRPAFRHALIQVDERTGEEFVHVHPECVDYLEEQGPGGGVALPWAESMRIIEGLLAPAATPPHIIAFGWQPGDLVLWDNRSTMHAASPTHRNQEGSDELYVALGERRLMFRTERQATWTPHLVGEAPGSPASARPAAPSKL